MNIDKCPRCGLRHSSEDCPSTMAAFHLSRMDPDYSAPAAPQAPSGQPCTVCGTPYEKHGSYPTCATHPYTPSGQQAESPHDSFKNGYAAGRAAATQELAAALAGQQSERPAVSLDALPYRMYAPAEVRALIEQDRAERPAGQAVGELEAMRMLWDDQPPEERAHYLAVVERAALAASQAERPAVKEGDRA